MRLRTAGLISTARPVGEYESAVSAIHALQIWPTPEPDNPETRPIFLTHGQKTAKAILLLHGYTSSPVQFKQLGEQFFALGYNVFMPRFPLHGLQDRLTEALAEQKAEELCAMADMAADVMSGLGDHVTVMGLSMGGVMAGWLGQQRDDIDEMVLIAPALGVKSVPALATGTMTRTYLTAPNKFMWWGDPVTAEVAQQSHAYPRFATKGLVELMRVALKLRDMVKADAPKVKRVVLVDNDNDGAVNAALIEQLSADYHHHLGDSFSTYTFSAEHQLNHDLIEPTHVNQNIALVYPILIKLVENN